MDTTKEEFDKKWNTCRHCGITKEEIEEAKKNGDKYTSNFVINNECMICRDKIENRRDFEEATKEGEIKREKMKLIKILKGYLVWLGISKKCPNCGSEIIYYGYSYIKCIKCDWGT